jgi:hypothetical protein
MHWVLALCTFFHYSFISGHGFSGNTYVKVPPGHWESIEQLVEHSETQSVMSYHYKNQQHHSHKILARARSTTNCYYTINLDNSPFADITCSPLQQFYLPEKNCWSPAHALEVGDVLLTEREGNLPIVRITFVEQQLDLYALKIECPHTFFVGRHSVLTHNMNLPVASLCWELPLTISTISTVGGLFTGFAAAASGVTVSAIAASLIYSAVMDYKAKRYHKVEIPKDTVALFAQKQNNTPKAPQGGKNNPNQPLDPNGKKPRCTNKVANMHALFALNEFGQRLKECSEPTRHLYRHHARIFRVVKDALGYGLKRGYLFYLDTLHYDHIEVFAEKGQRCVTVLNIDGSYNAQVSLWMQLAITEQLASGYNEYRFLL